MELPLMFFGVIVVCGLLLMIAEPYRFMPETNNKAKKVGATYWGSYEGVSPEEPEEMRQVELQKVARKLHYAAGSITYSQGRGVAMNGRK